MWLVCLCILGCIGFSTNSAYSDDTPKATPNAFYIFKDGTMVGLVVSLKTKPRAELLMDASHQFLWLRFNIDGVRLLLTPQGGVFVESIQFKRYPTLNYNAQGNISQINQTTFHYALTGRIEKIGNLTLHYEPSGLISQINQIKIQKRYDHKLTAIGSLKFAYHDDGKFKSIGDIAVQYQMGNKISSIGGLSFSYHPDHGIYRQSQGSEARVRVSMLWIYQDIFHVLRKKMRK